MTTAGTRCDLHVFKNRGHMFINNLDDYVDALVKADAFLASLGFVQGEPDRELVLSTR